MQRQQLPLDAPQNCVVLTLTTLYGATMLAVWLLWSGL